MTQNKNLLEEIQAETFDMGVDIFGVASALTYGEEFPEHPSPNLFVPNAQSIILIGEIIEPSTMRTVLYPELANSSWLHAQDSNVGGGHHLAPQKYFMIEETEVIKTELTSIGRHITRKLRHLGYSAMNMPLCKRDKFTLKAPFVHAPAMYLAGIGTRGMNHTMLTPDFGCRFYVNSIITDCPLPTGKPMEEELCLQCNLCVRACPIGALKEDGTKDTHACYDYGTCSSCIAVCPVGEVRPFTPQEVIRWLDDDREIWTLENHQKSKDKHIR